MIRDGYWHKVRGFRAIDNVKIVGDYGGMICGEMMLRF